MWMMGYNEPLEDHMNNINTLEPYTTTTNNNNNATRKLRPLVPRPPPPICSSYNRFHHDHNLHSPGEQNKREFSSQQMVVVSSRWNPTPEQLQTLEELYRRGTRTPSAEEIQHITAQLRRFGKIEGKNVFYWFQNHKARERQKRRRQLDKDLHFNSIHLDQSIQRKDSPEVEETRNWAIPTFSDQKVNMGREKSRKAADDGWMIEQQQEEEQEGSGTDQLQRRRKSIPATTATWNNMMHCNLSSSSSSAHPTNHNSTASLIGSTSCCNPTTTFASKTSSSVVVTSRRHDNCDVLESYETLELFPVNNSSSSGPNSEEGVEKLCLIDEMNSSSREVNFCPTAPHFIEFLPLKN